MRLNSKQALNKHAMKQIYTSLIYPHLTYCQTVWGATHKNTLKSLRTAQKRSVRTILGLKKFDHTHDGFTDLKLLKLCEINVYC